MTIRRRRITARGVTPVGLTQFAFENFWLYGAVCPAEGVSFTQAAERLNSTTFQGMLDAFAKTYAETLNIVVVDNSRAHHAKTVQLPENVRLLFLPAYSPELNPIERGWLDVKDQLAWWRGTLDELKTAVSACLTRYTPETITSLTSFAYFVLPNNAK